MGENEQGGMLRTVVVIGLVALIATTIIGGVIASKASMNKHVMATTSLVEKMAKNDTGTSGKDVAPVTDDASKSLFRYDSFDDSSKTVEIEGYDFNYMLKPDYNSRSRDLVIPSKVVKNGVTYQVTSIGISAFQDKQLTSVTIPDGVTSLSDYAFDNNQLTSIDIPDSVTVIAPSVFSNNQLTSVTIPKGVTSIEQDTFSNNKLTSVTIPNSVTSIGDAAFFNNQLTSVTVPNSVTNIADGVFDESVKIDRK